MSAPAYVNTFTVLNVVTSTTTSSGYDISQRQQTCLQFIATGISTGNGVFTVDGSNDNTNWITGIAVLDTTEVSGTFVTSVTLSSNTTKAVYVPVGFKYIRVKATVTTDGSYTAILQVTG